jgi:cell division protein ZapA
MKGVNVEIMGQNLVVASDGGDDWVRHIAQEVDARIRQIREAGQAAASINIAILAALNFAEELERLKREHEELIGQIEALNGRLAQAIGAVAER